jgi:hypothetical protein
MTPIEILKRLAELQKDATRAAIDLPYEARSTDFAALAEYVEGLESRADTVSAAVRYAIKELEQNYNECFDDDEQPSVLLKKESFYKALAALRGLGDKNER